MSLDTSEWSKLSFDTQFNYLHIVKKGTVTTNGTVSIPLPAGLTNPFFRLFIVEGTEVYPSGGYFNTGTDGRIIGSDLVITRYGGGGGTPSSVTFTYFIYGGNYDG